MRVIQGVKFHVPLLEFLFISSAPQSAAPPPPLNALKTTLTAVPLTAMATVLQAARGGTHHPDPQDKAITFKTSATHSSAAGQEVQKHIQITLGTHFFQK